MDVTGWLLDSDPSIRWQVMRDLTGESAEAVAAERSRVATEGWGARILELQDARGFWGVEDYGPTGTETVPTLCLLRLLGLDPASAQARTAVGLLRDHAWTEFGGQPFFGGEVEPCVNGRILALAGYFGELGAGSDRLVDLLIGEQLEDGGWNCQAPQDSRSSFHTTICVLEGLLQYEQSAGPSRAVTDARLRGEEYLLARRLFRSLSTGKVIDQEWTSFSFPPQWHYDVLRALDYFRGTGAEPDPRCAEAIALLREKRRPDGRWLLEHAHPEGTWFAVDAGPGEPSRWNTLRALRVLRWYDGGQPRR